MIRRRMRQFYVAAMPLLERNVVAVTRKTAFFSRANILEAHKRAAGARGESVYIRAERGVEPRPCRVSSSARQKQSLRIPKASLTPRAEHASSRYFPLDEPVWSDCTVDAPGENSSTHSFQRLASTPHSANLLYTKVTHDG